MKTVKVRGLNGIIANLHAWDKDLRADIQNENVIAASSIVRLAQEFAPYVSGLTHDAIKPRFSEGGLTFEVFVDPQDFADKGVVYYAFFVHQGTRFQDANPFLLKAYDTQMPNFRPRISSAVRRSLRRG